MSNPAIKQPPSSILEKLVGQRIVSIRRSTSEEMAKAGWHRNPVVIELQDGTWLVSMSDEEGNDGGALYVVPKRGKAEVL